MSIPTTNYNLIKDKENEYYDIEKVNSNLDKVDGAIKDRANELLEHNNSPMPHQARDLTTNKTYKFGLQLTGGKPQFIYEEVL